MILRSEAVVLARNGSFAQCGVDHMKLICNNLKGIANTPCIGAYEEGMVMMKYNEVKVQKAR